MIPDADVLLLLSPCVGRLAACRQKDVCLYLDQLSCAVTCAQPD